MCWVAVRTDVIGSTERSCAGHQAYYAYRVVCEPDPTAVWRIAAVLAVANSAPILFKAEQSADGWVEAVCVLHCAAPATAELILRKLQQLPFSTEVEVVDA